MSRKAAPYGSWRSPIDAESAARGSAVPIELSVDGDDIYWLELRPEQGGRYALCTLRGGRGEEVLGREFNVRTRVHEYGGGSYLVHGGTIYFVNFSDQVLYMKEKGARQTPLGARGVRYADFVADEGRKRVVAVSEDHRKPRDVVNAISAVSTGGTKELVSGNDFYSSPRLSADGRRLSWLTWNHPNMPWDGTELWVADLQENGTVGDPRMAAGGKDESVFQPEWSPDGALYFVSDRSGWWNLHRLSSGRTETVVSMDAEFGRPQWQFGYSTYAFLSERKMLCSFLRDGEWHLALLDTRSLNLKELKTPFTDIDYVRAGRRGGFFVGSSPTRSSAVVRVERTGGTRVVYRSRGPHVDPGYISVPAHIHFPTTGGKTAHAFFYEPRNARFRAAQGEKPPLIVMSHGGPTSFSPNSLTHPDRGMVVQYWTSRGFAVLYVNYRGSTGYGRMYMKELEGQWGIVDTDDCTNGALYLARLGKVDGKRMAIRGGSAGGFTTLCALTFKDTFAAGASYFGVSDLEGLEKDTHKFESHYCDRLVAPYPERRDVYIDRSPIHHTDELVTPVIFFQGLEDVIVTPDQSERMVDALRKKGVPVAYIAFEGEQHGFRKAETVVRAYGAELYFYSKVLGFPLGEKVEQVDIWNMTRR